MNLRRRSVLAGLGAGAALAGCGPRRPPPINAFDGRLADWTREILRDSPELASQAGVSESDAGGPYLSRLDDRSTEAVDARRSAAIRRLAELRMLNREETADAVTLDVLEAQFANAAEAAGYDFGDFTPLGGVRPYVLNQLDCAFLNLPSFMDERHDITDEASTEAYLARLRAAADVIDDETARTRRDADNGIRAPDIIMDQTYAALQSLTALPFEQQPYLASLRRKLTALADAEQDPARKTQLEERHGLVIARAEQIMRDHVLPAHQRAMLYLRADRSNAGDATGVSRLPHGAEFYAAALKIETTTSLTPNEIHDIGLARVAALATELDVALRRVALTEGTVAERLAQLTADPRYRYPDSDEGRAALVADVQRRVATVLERAPQWFGSLPRARLEVRRVPAFAEEGMPGAYYNPPSLDGQTPGVYYLNLRNLAELTRIDLPTQDFHEAAPGHHFQIAIAQSLTDMPLLRRLLHFNAYTEGWGLYAEQLADEVGLHEGDPVGRIGYLRWQLWRAGRLVVDTGIHAKQWTRDQAIEYLAATTGDLRSLIQTEVDRYIVWPAQACGYELGRREISRLREVARNQLGPDFDLRGFHDAILSQGELPLSVLAQVVTAWIPRQRRLAQRERNRR